MKSFEVQSAEAGEEIEKEEAETKVRTLLQEVAVMGRNDSEFSRFNEILDLLRRGECTPQEAVKMAHEVRDSKQEH